jgi:alpha-amylase/alpha-mannosidase (GH57 family)
MSYVCIHGHFYQPPRENPWLEAVELQDSAYPYHDWNARVSAECYSHNAASRILDGDGRIASIVNNFASISFDFGPTLLSWLEQQDPATYRAILEADRRTRERSGGHGAALAQAYNHLILPLANHRDKETQVIWGARDFERRFGRRPAGMWLPETAVDLETLDLLALHGIRFTILAPSQAALVRPLSRGPLGNAEEQQEEEAWQDVSGGRIDPTRAYLQRLPSGRSIALFFYDGPISRAVAFEELLNSGEAFAQRLVGGFSGDRDWPELMHIATDGESYGHHHRDGDMALAYALDTLEREGLAELIQYESYLDRHPPDHEVRILENTAWSCAHGLGRWSADCGCNSGAQGGWNQGWRAPLRAALDWLRDRLVPLFEEHGSELLEDCWAARNAYLDVVADRSPENVAGFLRRQRRGKEDAAADVRRLELLEMQRHALLMYTSCGWFFDDVSGIETVQVIQYAARALQLAEKLSGQRLEAEFLERLGAARSNLPDPGDGRRIYEEWVKPAMVEPVHVGAHYAVSSLFSDHPERAAVYCHAVAREEHEVREAGRLVLHAGRATVHSTITGESTPFGYAVAHLGHYNVAAGVSGGMGREEWQDMLADVDEAFGRGDIAEIVRRIDQRFPGRPFSLRSLFRDEQRRVLGVLLADTLEEIEATYLDIHRRHAQLGLLLAELRIPIPPALRRADERAIHHQLEVALRGPRIDLDQVRMLLESAHQHRTELDSTHLEYTLRGTLEDIARRLEEAPGDEEPLQDLENAVEVMEVLPFGVNLWSVQNAYFRVLQEKVRAPGLPTTWAERFLALGSRLGVAVTRGPS